MFFVTFLSFRDYICEKEKRVVIPLQNMIDL